jgi:hypothetical protein
MERQYYNQNCNSMTFSKTSTGFVRSTSRKYYIMESYHEFNKIKLLQWRLIIIKYNVTSTVWLYTASYHGQLYTQFFMFLIHLSLFSLTVFHFSVVTSYTQYTQYYYVLLTLLFFHLCILYFSFCHGIRASDVSLFT